MLLLVQSDSKRRRSSVDEIEAKLKEAALRRQQFHAWVASKAKTRRMTVGPRSGSASGPKGGEGKQGLRDSSEGVAGGATADTSSASMAAGAQQEAMLERLYSRLEAARKKREELERQQRRRQERSAAQRQQAACEVRQRLEAKAAELETLRGARDEKAGNIRAALLEAEREKRAAVRKRAAKLRVRREEQEWRDHQRALQRLQALGERLEAAQRKRRERLEAERDRAAAVSAQARQVAESVWRERERELEQRRERLAAKMAQAHRRRTKVLSDRGGCKGACHRHAVHHAHAHRGKRLQWEQLSRKLSHCWRAFRRQNKTSAQLARAFMECGAHSLALQGEPFEKVAQRISAPATITAAKALLQRLLLRLTLVPEQEAMAWGSQAGRGLNATALPSQVDGAKTLCSHAPSTLVLPKSDIGHLLARLLPPAKRAPARRQTSRAASQQQQQGEAGGAEQAADLQKKPKPGQASSSLAPRGGQQGQASSSSSGAGAAAGPASGSLNPDRYPVRPFLSAYMVVLHPQEVMTSTSGQTAEAVTGAAARLVGAFESVVRRLMAEVQLGEAAPEESKGGQNSGEGAKKVVGVAVASTKKCGKGPREACVAAKGNKGKEEGSPCPAKSSPKQSRSEGAKKAEGALVALPGRQQQQQQQQPQDRQQEKVPFRQLLLGFDQAWVEFLHVFVAWKLEDERQLESDLVGAACRLEASMLRKCGGRPQHELSHDVQAIREQVASDHRLLRVRIQRLTGAAGVDRLDAALHQVRMQASGDPSTSSSSSSSSCCSSGLSSSDTNSSSSSAPSSPRGSSSSPSATSTPSHSPSISPFRGSSRPSPGPWPHLPSMTLPPPAVSAVSPGATRSDPASASGPALEADPAPAAGAAPDACPTQRVAAASLGGAGQPGTAVRKGSSETGRPSPEGRGGGRGRGEGSASAQGKGSVDGGGSGDGPGNGESRGSGRGKGDGGEGGVDLAQERRGALPSHLPPRMAMLLQERMYLEVEAEAALGTPFPRSSSSDTKGAGSDMILDAMDAPGAPVEVAVRQSMEAAFWGTVRDSLLASPPDMARAEALVVELHDDLRKLVPRQDLGLRDRLDASLARALGALQQLKQMLLHADAEGSSRSSDPAVPEAAPIPPPAALGAPAAAPVLAQFAAVLDNLTAVLVYLGSEAREGPTKASLAAVKARLEAVTREGSKEDAVQAVVDGLAFLFQLLQALKKDTAAAAVFLMPPFAAIELLRSSFATEYNLSKQLPTEPVELKEKLPRTYQWMAEAAQAASVSGSGPELNTDKKGSASAAVPVLRAGRAGGQSGALKWGPSMSAAAAAAAALPSGVSAALREGVVRLVVRAEGAEPGNVPETLVNDVLRLRKCQEHFQRIVVAATGFLLVRQALLTSSVPLSPAIDELLEERLPQLKEAFAATDVSAASLGKLLGGVAADAAVLSGNKDLPAPHFEPLLAKLLSKSLDPKGAIFAKVSGAVAEALKIVSLDLAQSNGLAAENMAAVQAELKKGGASALLPETLIVAKDILSVCNVSALVHASLYSDLAEAL